MSDVTNADLEKAFDELKAMNADLEKLDKLHRTHKILFYEPIGEQHKFFSSSARTRCVFGSNRSGKSVVGTLELISAAIGYRPWLPPEHPDRIVTLGDGTLCCSRQLPLQSLAIHANQTCFFSFALRFTV